jgi:hypothetical protein
MTEYIRKELSTETLKDCTQTASKIVGRYKGLELIAGIAMLCQENARLTAEVNEHRAALGYEPLKVHKGIK